ncbi:MAG TPA: cupin domain-containing protein [Vicinamibacterales bacterium]|jgi:quercetin dioxygenase-like cupin family protein|nr:cupin domain-containing protein [Vicinamibacterales bacterium]
MAIDVSFRWGVHAAILGAGLTVAALHAQAPAGSAQANQPLFTGTSTVMDGKDLSAARRRFEPGARTYWHSHDNGQLLYVEAGRMWAAKRGQAKHELGPGESDYTGPNVEHWHGATTQSHLIQVNVGFGGGTKWLDAVPEAEYRK